MSLPTHKLNAKCLKSSKISNVSQESESSSLQPPWGNLHVTLHWLIYEYSTSEVMTDDFWLWNYDIWPSILKWTNGRLLKNIRQFHHGHVKICMLGIQNIEFWNTIENGRRYNSFHYYFCYVFINRGWICRKPGR